jgi:cytochrome P450
MTDIEETEIIPEFPMKRASGCPFDPPPDLKELQERTPITKVRLSNGIMPWLVTGYEDQKAVLGDPRISSDATNPGYPFEEEMPEDPAAGVGFILMDDPEHARLRRMVTAPFAVKRIEAMRPTVQRIVDDFIDRMLDGPNPTDLVEAFALPVPSLVISELLGVDYEDHEFFQRNSKVLVSIGSTVTEKGQAMGNLHAYLNGLMARKTAEPGDDLMSGLVERVENGEITSTDAAGIGVLLLLAGHETTANMIALGTLALFEHPEQLAALRETDDPKLISSAVEELLRYLHITHDGRRRVALEDMKIAGQTVRAGEGVIVPNDIGNRDGRVFADPDRLDIVRGDRRHVAFGFGVHQCLGQTLARMELQVVYGTLYKRVPTLRLACDIEDLPFKHEARVYGVHEMPVTW